MTMKYRKIGAALMIVAMAGMMLMPYAVAEENGAFSQDEYIYPKPEKVITSELGQEQIYTSGTRATRATWYGAPNWQYRKELTITNPDAITYTNVTVKIALTFSDGGIVFTNSRSDGHDIRFVSNDHSTLISHWREYWSYTNTDAVFWMKAPSLPASTTITYWLYYGYAAASADLSNGSAVFTLFDDFDYSTYRDCETDGLVGNAGGSIMVKQTGPVYTPDTDVFESSQAKMMGITSTTNTTEGQIFAYGSYMNASYACILGMNSTLGIADYTDFTNVLVNHSATGAAPDFIKATEPDFLTDITHATHYAPVKEHGADNNYSLFYSGLNATNYSINLATSPVFDAEYTKNPWNPVLFNGSGNVFDGAGCRKPVTWKDGENDYRMLYAGMNTTTQVWKIGYATAGANQSDWTKAQDWSVFNGSSLWGWDNKSVIPLAINHDGTYYELMYAGSDWENNWRIGVAYTTDFYSWSTWGGVIGLGDTGDWDGHDVNYGTYTIYEYSDPGEKWVVHQTGLNSSGNVQLGHAFVLNSTITDWSSWQNEGSGSTCYHVDTDGRLNVQWNQTILHRAVTKQNESVSVDFWPTDTDTHNISLLGRSAGDYWGNAEDYYAMQAESALNTSDIVEMTAGTWGEQNSTAFNITGTAQHYMNLRYYGEYLYSNGEGFASNNTATGAGSDATIDEGEIGIRVDNPATVKFDYFRSVGSSNGSITLSMGSEVGYVAPESTGGSFIPQEIDPVEPVVEDDDNILDGTECCGTLQIVVGSVAAYAGMVLIGIAAKSPKFPFRKKEQGGGETE